MRRKWKVDKSTQTTIMPAGANARVVAEGIFTHEGDLNEFLCTLKESELCKSHHHTKDMQVDYGGGKIKITLYFVDVVDFLIKSSLKDGMLRQWGKQFTITSPVLAA